MIKSLWAFAMNDPRFMRRANGFLTLAWLAVTPVIIIYLRESVPFLVFISVYAVVTGHWAAWQAARVEVRQEKDADVLKDAGLVPLEKAAARASSRSAGKKASG